MADQPGQSQDMGYERLGEAKLSLVDVIAQSVGFMGPVFSAAFLIPLIVGSERRPPRARALPRRCRC